jgi:hypothetical protein
VLNQASLRTFQDLLKPITGLKRLQIKSELSRFLSLSLSRDNRTSFKTEIYVQCDNKQL